MLVQSFAPSRAPGRPTGRGGCPQHPRMDPDRTPSSKSFDESGIHRRLHGPRPGVSSRPKNLALRWSLSSWPGSTPAPLPAAGRLPGALPIHERRHPGAARLLHECCAPASPARTASPGAAPSPLLSQSLMWASKRHARGKVKVAEWNPGEEPMLQVESAAASLPTWRSPTSSPPRGFRRPAHQGNLHVILERPTPHLRPRHSTRKLVHQLSSTNDPSSACAFPPAASSAATASRTVKSSRATAMARSSKPSPRTRSP